MERPQFIDDFLESDYGKRLKKEAEEMKLKITDERINKLLLTQDLHNTFESINTSTLSVFGIATMEKKLYVLDFLEKHIADENLLKNFETIYIGSGDDLEYPLCLGARKIIMLDPSLKEPTLLQELRKKIEKISDNNYKEDKNHFYFKFNFNGNEENVVITLDTRIYTKEEDAYVPKTDHFIPTYNVGAIIAFQSIDPTQNNETIKKLHSGGFILTNKTLEKFNEEYMKQPETKPDEKRLFDEADVNEKRKILEKFYKTKGFSSINLESFENQYQGILLQKD